MEILENRAQWLADFRAGWLAHLQQTGETDWKRYPSPKNKHIPAGSGINLSSSRLALITSAGGYLPDLHQPFDAPDPLGDYSIRLFPSSTPLNRLAFAHTHYDHAAVNQDPQVLVPLRHLEDMVGDGLIGELAPTVVSFMGYQPDVTRLVDELVPAIRSAVRDSGANAALLVPA